MELNVGIDMNKLMYIQSSLETLRLRNLMVDTSCARYIDNVLVAENHWSLLGAGTCGNCACMALLSHKTPRTGDETWSPRCTTSTCAPTSSGNLLCRRGWWCQCLMGDN